MCVNFCRMRNGRIRERRLRIWTVDYLHYRYLWPNVEKAIQTARSSVSVLRPLVLDIGCGHKPYRDLFGECDYIGLDYSASDSSPNVLGDATRLPVNAEMAHIVFSTQVLEHVPDPRSMIRECHRVLKPNGYLIITAPFFWPLHEKPWDFHRFTKFAFEHYLADAGFKSWQIKEDGGDWAQFFLSVSLKLRRRWMAPLRVVSNCTGAVLDSIAKSTEMPANYTVLAQR